MGRAAFIGAMWGVLAGSSCGVPSAMDAGVPPDSGGIDLPLVLPAARPCRELPSQEGAACIEGGWFFVSRWTTAVGQDDMGERRRRPEPVYLDAFALDRTEVTRSAFLDFVNSPDAGVHAPPSDCGGFIIGDAEYPEIGFEWIPERSGWSDAGVPLPGTELAPVTCVTRGEAMAYCAYRGGRLPTSFEFFRAVRGAFPSARRFPWGDELPSPLRDFYAHYAAVSLRRESGPPPVGSRRRGGSDAEVHDLVGSASEFLHECEEELDDAPFDGGFAVRPRRGPFTPQCREGVLIAGDNWYSERLTIPMLGATSVLAMKDYDLGWPGDPCVLLEGTDVCIDYLAFEALGPTRPPDGLAETRGNQRRSWSVGFRCAYDSH